jgi:UDP-N-acetylglucosamine--N-acetylmuramyl-(pentapeptide) pyrophosphoryl-undecaprenol N-acetylglucosamine transferase
MLRVIISGGGTGGHVFPAIAIADAIREEVPGAAILFVGANGKLEMEKVPEAGYDIAGLDIVGFQRRLTIRNLIFPFKLAASMARALSIVRGFQPDVVVGVGGYASGPVLKIANLLGIPTVLQEQNSYAGVTNRLLASKAAKVCVAYPDMDRFFPAEKLVFTGNPVRKTLALNRLSANEARASLGLRPEVPTVLIFGGSLGARTINEAVMKHADALAGMTELNLIWQAGKMYFEDCRSSSLSGCAHVRILPFIENMDIAYAAADIVVCRAGALTISELALLGKASILVPSPNVAEDHQTANALALSEKGAALLIRDVEVGQSLVSEIKALLEDKQKRRSLEENIKQFARPNAARDIAGIVLRCTKKREYATE